MTIAKHPPRIQKIKGTNPILLIAPHGYTRDDEKTNEISRLMAKRLKCYAVINEYYQRPRITDPNTGEEKFGGPADPKKNLFDLNDLTHVRKYLGAEFLQPILDFKNEITKTSQATVVLIHGMKDGSAVYKKSPKDKKGKPVDIFIGVGLDRPKKKSREDRETFPEAEKLKTILGEKRSKPIKAEIYRGTDGFSGWAYRNLNQLFNAPTNKYKKYKDDKVDSIQLEIKKTGFRDTTVNIESAAERLSATLAELLGIDLATEEKGEEKGKEVAVLPEEAKPDITLVDEAYYAVADIFSRHYENALLEAGRYIIDTFYGGSIELAKDKNSTKKQSLNQLMERFHGQGTGAPSRSWINNAINLVADDERYRTVQAYGQLTASNKVLLLPIKDEDLKTQLIEETAKENYPTRKLKERIREVKPKRQRRPSIERIISKPDKLISTDFSAQFGKDYLGSLSPDKIKELRAQAQAQVAQQQAYIERYNQLIQAFDTAIEEQAPLAEKQKE